MLYKKAKMRGAILFVVVLFLVLPFSLVEGEEVLTNETIIKMVKANLGEPIIISKIENSKINFDLSTDGIIKLKEAGVGEKIIEAMMGKKERPAEAKIQDGVKEEKREREKTQKGGFMAAIQPVEKTFPAVYNETWKAVVQAIAAIGKSIAVADKDSGVISTRQSELRGGGGYGFAKNSKDSLNIVVNRISDEKTKVSIKRTVTSFRSFMFGHSRSEDPSDGSVEENLIKNISSLVKVQPMEGLEIERVEWKRGDPLPNKK